MLQRGSELRLLDRVWFASTRKPDWGLTHDQGHAPDVNRCACEAIGLPK